MGPGGPKGPIGPCGPSGPGLPRDPFSGKHWQTEQFLPPQGLPYFLLLPYSYCMVKRINISDQGAVPKDSVHLKKHLMEILSAGALEG